MGNNGHHDAYLALSVAWACQRHAQELSQLEGARPDPALRAAVDMYLRSAQQYMELEGHLQASQLQASQPSVVFKTPIAPMSRSACDHETAQHVGRIFAASMTPFQSEALEPISLYPYPVSRTSHIVDGTEWWESCWP